MKFERERWVVEDKDIAQLKEAAAIHGWPKAGGMVAQQHVAYDTPAYYAVRRALYKESGHRGGKANAARIKKEKEAKEAKMYPKMQQMELPFE